MTDMTAPGSHTGSAVRPSVEAAEATEQRIRRRYRAEARFKWYGITAISLSITFICLLFASILHTGLPAFTHHFLTAKVTVAPDAVDPSGKRDPQEIASADFFALAGNTLREKFPEVSDRRDRNRLTQLLSSGAADPLRQRVTSEPGIIGSQIDLAMPLSANADIYLKGGVTDISRIRGRGAATPSGTSGEITILTASNDFGTQLVAIKRDLSERARQMRREADRMEASAAGQVVPRVQQLRDEAKALQGRFDASQGSEALDDKMPSLLVAINGGMVKLNRIDNARVTGDVIRPLTSAAEAPAGAWEVVTFTTPESARKVTDKEVVWIETLKSQGLIERRFNWRFFTAGDSREPELAGIRGAITGSLLMLLVTLVLCLPIGVMAAIYLEEFAPKNWVTDLIEVNINNLAAVPSIVFGLLGLAVFLNFFNMPRSAPLVGGLVLALLVLPTIIIAARAAIKAVPPSIREGALGVGASHQQAVFHHVLPLAMPGIMTGTIIGMAHALGETAPLLMIGMIAFIVDIPKSFTEAATVLPVQIYLWSDLPELAFKAKTAAAIMVLLVFLFVMNGMAIYLRKRFERRW
jgi:phosphate transport system permease protein